MYDIRWTHILQSTSCDPFKAIERIILYNLSFVYLRGFGLLYLWLQFKCKYIVQGWSIVSASSAGCEKDHVVCFGCFLVTYCQYHVSSCRWDTSFQALAQDWVLWDERICKLLISPICSSRLDHSGGWLWQSAGAEIHSKPQHCNTAVAIKCWKG